MDTAAARRTRVPSSRSENRDFNLGLESLLNSLRSLSHILTSRKRLQCSIGRGCQRSQMLQYQAAPRGEMTIQEFLDDS